ncbi:MAG: rhodanese-like domain-containing protein [Micrococcales bacterium]|nr:rhodanese-like domain-containing protein [Micrococcales bacterium]
MDKHRTMSRSVGILLTLVPALLAGSFALSGCGSPKPAPADGVDTSDATILDVRAPDEFAEGHLEGAINIDIRASDFEPQIEALPRDTHYFVYCRAGARAAMAVAQMESSGFTNVTLAGGIDEAAKLLDVPIVT